MTFDKQVKEAKKKKLENNITRDILLILAGIIFLVITIYIKFYK